MIRTIAESSVKERIAGRILHIGPMAIYGFFYLLWFGIIEDVERKEYLVLGSELDQAIPFVEAFVIPYLSWFPFMLIWGLALLLADKEAFDRLSTFLMIGMTFFLIVSSLVPTAVNLRPAVLIRNNIFTDLIRLLWKADTPTNVWPSIHVFNTAAIYMAAVRSTLYRKMKTPVRILLGVWSVSICLSTVLIKQHSLLDVLAGLIMMVVLSFFIYDLNLVFRFARWDAFCARRLAGMPARRKKRVYLRE